MIEKRISPQAKPGMAGLHLPAPAQADAAITSLSRWLGAGP